MRRMLRGRTIMLKKVLVTNDDGINASGIWSLVNYLSSIADVYVVAPEEQQSAKSQSITFLTEVEATETAMLGATEAYALKGTPTDCVNWGITKFRKSGIKFDYIFSGINIGTNTGLAAYYSGTISAAREGALHGIRSIALSVGGREASEFDYICSLIPKVLEMSDSLSASTILSVNAPDLPVWAVKGFRIAEAAPWGYGETYRFTKTDTGYQLGSHLNGTETGELRYDFDCINNGYASVSPLISHISDEAAFRKLSGLFPQDKTLAVIVDVQDGLASSIAGGERVISNITKFARCMARLDVPCALTELYGYGQTLPAVAAAADTGSRTETVLRREWNAWGSAEFSKLMSNMAADKVLIAGLETHAAVMQTALGYMRKGYDVTVIEDCCASRTGHDHKMAIAELRDMGCKVTTLRAALARMLFAVNHPAADSVMRILSE